ncbi:hypothetical protein AHMF7605_26845 [Adhaeribacter arboris]|uniref:Uncharacterized protein n=1 Tax=Adhaeribacter arboris TaxID=2072846 RepID=A0A2T2YMZ7_9BACT|nr:hypothetical protein [Adhaeribacter arboris]PSR56859.1 hypothetical protein AHMF7605_26845 [Adhaeribacter arboris]
MRPELEEIKQLENYLKNNLPEEQTLELEIRLLWDLDWQRALAQQKLAYQALRVAGREQLRKELKAIHQRLYS